MRISATRVIVTICSSLLLTACGGSGGGGASNETSRDNSTVTTSSSRSNSPYSSENFETNNSVSQSRQTQTEENISQPAQQQEQEHDNPGQTVTISWSPPNNREDGSSLEFSELKGYEIYYFQEGSNQEETVAINSPYHTKYQAGPLSSGTYYFAITSIDHHGQYSDLSDYAEITIP